MAIRELLECDNCGGGLDFFNEQTVVCACCKKRIEVIGDGNTFIFSKVYDVIDGSPRTLKFTEDELKDGSWRHLNYAITREWLSSLNNADLVLDLGSGPLTNYELLRTNRTIFFDGGQYDGVNIVADANKRFPLDSGSVDAVLASNVFEHLPNPQQTMSEISRVLSKHGAGLILVPFVIKLHQEPLDYQRFTKHGLRRLAESSGLEVTEIREIGGFSNILGTILRIAIKRTPNPMKKLILRLQYRLWAIGRMAFGDDQPDKIMPQGYGLFVMKR